MHVKSAVAQRIRNLCMERNISINALAKRSNVSPSTIYSMLNEKSQNPGIVSIEMLCRGLDLSVKDFYNSSLFG